MNLPGVWIAYYPDWSNVIVFETEVEALRYAVTNDMQAGFVPFGCSVKDVS